MDLLLALRSHECVTMVTLATRGAHILAIEFIFIASWLNGITLPRQIHGPGAEIEKRLFAGSFFTHPDDL